MLFVNVKTNELITKSNLINEIACRYIPIETLQIKEFIRQFVIIISMIN